jgi:hypothetical protein
VMAITRISLIDNSRGHETIVAKRCMATINAAYANPSACAWASLCSVDVQVKEVTLSLSRNFLPTPYALKTIFGI